MTSASVVILNWNGGAEDCLEAVASALAQDHPDLEVIFVDNGSDDGSLEAVRERHPDLIYVETGENLGCPEGRNRGAEVATGEILFFLENDGVWRSDRVVSRAVEFFEAHPTVGVLYTEVTGYESGAPDPPLDNAAAWDQPGLASAFRGGAAAMRRSLFDRFGGFPGAFFRQAEERFLALQVWDAGYSVVYWPFETMAHKGSDYAGKNQQVTVYSLRNTLLTIDRLYPHPTVMVHLLAYGLVNFVRFRRAGELAAFWRAVREYREMRATFPRYRRISLGALWRVTRVQRGPARPVT